MGQRHQPQRVPAAARRRRLHLHAAQPQLPPPPPLLCRRARRLPARPPRRRLHCGRRLPQCGGRVPGAAVLLVLRPRRRRRPHRAGARYVPRPRRRLGRCWRGLRRPQEAPDQEPRVRRPLPRAQAGLRPRAREGGQVAAAGEPEPPRQVRAAEGHRGGAGEEDAAEDAVRAILRQEQIRLLSSFLMVVYSAA